MNEAGTNSMIVLLFENVVTFASFVCIASNTEDEKGLSVYEVVAISTGVLWGVHLNDITCVHILQRATGPYHLYNPNDELFDELSDI